MSMPLRIPIGAPGIYTFPETPLHALTGVRMDVCAFVGIAPRGPAREPVVNELWPADRPFLEDARPRRRSCPVAVESFSDYLRLFGGFEGPGLLPYSVASFFEQGGRRAYIVRIVHEYVDADKNFAAVARGNVPGVGSDAIPLKLVARNEGSWGNKLRAAIEFSTRPVEVESNPDTSTLVFDAGVDVPSGTTFRLTLDNENKEHVLRLAAVTELQPRANSKGSTIVVTLDIALTEKVVAAEIIKGILLVDDGAGHLERHEELGFSSLHPRWIATVICNESNLVFPDKSWSNNSVLPVSPELLDPGWSSLFDGGKDRYSEVEPEDYFDPRWVLGNDEPGEGIHSLTQTSDLSLLVVPDLYSPFPLADLQNITEPVSLAGPEFATCIELPGGQVEQTATVQDLERLRLDPRDAGELKEIISLQQRVVKLAATLRSFMALLDVPPGLNQHQILKWRAQFDSDFAATYHPWLRVSRRDDSRDALVRIPPSSVAAGIIAKQEIDFGVPQGPANVLGAEVVSVDEEVSPTRHDELHPLGINVYRRERDGIRLSGARTLTRDPQFRQVSVRRLLTMLRRALEQQMQWLVFEPNGPALRAEVELLVKNYLRQLFNLGAFRGATEDQSFYVRCDETNNPNYVTDAGRLVAEIGVAPAEPLEFIVLRLVREPDGTLLLGER